MKEKIIQKAAELHFKYGIKNVTMDQIAQELGISKKTIYTYFLNKDDLVSQTSDYIFDRVQSEIDKIYSMKLNPYEELFHVKGVVKRMLSNTKIAPYYQLKKYYPEIAERLEKKKFESMMEFLEHNLNKGIKKGYYKEDLDKEFIKRIYFANVQNINNEELFPPDQFDLAQLMDTFLGMFLSGISTKKGRKKMKEIIEVNK
jgi:AcrR family transcriptional regulator